MGPAIERMNLLATREALALVRPLVVQANRVQDLVSFPPADIAAQMGRVHDAIAAARVPFVNRARVENGA